MFGAAKPASTFGQPAANTQTGGGIFGSTNTASTGGGFFGQNTGQNQQQNPLGGSAFGQSAPASGFGSANTSLGGTGGAFGNSGGIFGAKPATPAFGAPNNTNTAANTSAPSLFGAKPAAPTFGATNTGTGGGLFGSANTNNNTASTGFGATNQAPGATGGSLFGQAGNTGTGLFGSTQPAQTQPAQTGGLFGSANTNTNQNTNQNTAGTSGGLFGNTNASSTFGSSLGGAKPGGLFGNTNSGFGSTFGSNTQQQQQQQQPLQFQQQQQQQLQLQQQQQPQGPVITPFTRPIDLPEASQQELQRMDEYIRQQQQLSEDLSHVIPGHSTLVTSIPRDVQLLRYKLTSVNETLRFDDHQLARVKKRVDNDFSDAELLSDVTRQPRKYDRLMPYFQRVVSVDDQLEQLALAMRDVQQAVTAEEFGKRVTYDDQGLQQLPNALRAENAYFMSLSDRVADLHRHIKDNEEGETIDETPSY